MWKWAVLFPLKRKLFKNIFPIRSRDKFTESDDAQIKIMNGERPVRVNCFLYFILGIT